MLKRQTPFELLCELPTLMAAWKSVRANKGAAGVDLVTVAEFERDLMGNLQSLAERLREGRYYPMPLRTVEMKKRSGGTRTLGILTVEDRIVQRGLLDVCEPLWERQVFLDCSFGFRPGRNVEMAVRRVLDYRAAGDAFVVDADIRDCFDSIRHDRLMRQVGERIRDKRLLALIRMYLDTGQALGTDPGADGTLIDRLSGYAADSVNAAVGHLLEERDYGGYGGYAGLPPGDPYGAPPPDESALRRQARNEALKRLGRDAALLGLTYLGRSRRLLSPASLAVAGAAVIAGAALPVASRALRKRLGADPGGVAAVQGGALSPLLCNIYLHEFDIALCGAGARLVRYADDFVLCCRDEGEARRAMDLAARKLEELGLQMHPEKSRIIRFDQGLEFLGYRFEQFAINAAPVPRDRPLAAAVLDESRERLAPAVARLREGVAAQARRGADRIGEIARRLRSGGKS